jgi:hypothetical protein
MKKQTPKKLADLSKLTPVFIKPRPDWDMQTGETSRTTRNSSPQPPVDDAVIESMFKQETHNPSVRDRNYGRQIPLDKDFYIDLLKQLNAANDAARHFEEEASRYLGTIERMSERHLAVTDSYRLLNDENLHLKRAYDEVSKKLNQKGFWSRLWDWC